MDMILLFFFHFIDNIYAHLLNNKLDNVIMIEYFYRIITFLLMIYEKENIQKKLINNTIYDMNKVYFRYCDSILF